MPALTVYPDATATEVHSTRAYHARWLIACGRVSRWGSLGYTAGVDAEELPAQAQHTAQAITQRMADRFGAPTVAHYRRVYESCGRPWPGDEEIRRRFPVADAS